MDHLNQDEYEHVERLIIKSANRFQIAGEPLNPFDTAVFFIKRHRCTGQRYTQVVARMSSIGDVRTLRSSREFRL